MDIRQRQTSAAVSRRTSLWLFEWAMLAYTAFTMLLIIVWWQRLVNPLSMVAGRAGGVVMTLALWQLYRYKPCKLTAVMRVASQLMLLGWWYPDVYELNRHLPSLDHLFAQAEQDIFDCQPALLFSQNFSSPLISEPLGLGYVSYYPMIAAVTIYFLVKRYDELTYATFIILTSFFMFYVIFIFLPVAGPQFYYACVGNDLIAQGHFPNVGHYFLNHQESLPIPGSDGYPVHFLVQVAHDAGERPSAAFPSSHVGVSVVLLWLARETRSLRLFMPLLVLTILMFFATFYIQAHYAIDAVAGIFAGTAIYFACRTIYRRIVF